MNQPTTPRKSCSLNPSLRLAHRAVPPAFTRSSNTNKAKQTATQTTAPLCAPNHPQKPFRIVLSNAEPSPLTRGEGRGRIAP